MVAAASIPADILRGMETRGCHCAHAQVLRERRNNLAWRPSGRSSSAAGRSLSRGTACTADGISAIWQRSRRLRAGRCRRPPETATAARSPNSVTDSAAPELQRANWQRPTGATTRLAGEWQGRPTDAAFPSPPSAPGDASSSAGPASASRDASGVCGSGWACSGSLLTGRAGSALAFQLGS